MPSLRNSPWIRGAPHRGFAAPICSTSVRMAARGTGPARTSRRRALGPPAAEPLPMPASRRCPAARRSAPCASPARHGRGAPKTVDLDGGAGGRGTVRLNTANCWRSARFSSATARCPQQISATDRSTTTSAASMRYPVAQLTRDQERAGRDVTVRGRGDHVPDRLDLGARQSMR